MLASCGGGGGGKSSDAVSTEIPPVAATIDSTMPGVQVSGGSVSFFGRGAGGDGSLSFVWDFGDGTTGDGNAITHVYSVAGTYHVSLTVADSHGRTATATGSVTITPLQAMASVEPSEADVGQDVTLQGTGFGVGTLAYSWDFGDGTAGLGQKVTHRYSAKGLYRARLTVTDSVGGVGSTTADINVLWDAPSLRFVRAPTSIFADQPVDIEVGPVSETDTIDWNYQNANFGRAKGKGLLKDFVFNGEVGRAEIRAIKTDKAGAQVTASTWVDVMTPPLPAMALKPSQLLTGRSSSVDFWIDLTTLQGLPISRPVRYQWDYGDNTGVADEGFDGFWGRHRYSQAGRYTVSVTATDRFNRTMQASATISVTNTQILSVLAGEDVRDFVDGMGGAARFRSPRRMAFDSEGNLIVEDAGNNALRRIQPDGTVTTIPWSAFGNSCADSPGTPERLSSVVADGQGSIYVGFGRCVSRMSPPDTARTIATDFVNPSALAADRFGNLFILDQGLRIRKIASDGSSSTPIQDGWGYPEGGAFRGKALAVSNDGTLYIGLETAVISVTSGGIATVFAGNPGEYGSADGPGSDARFGSINSMAFDSQGNLLIAQSNSVRRVSPSGYVSTVGALQFGETAYVAVSKNGEVFVSDEQGGRIYRLATDGSLTLFAGGADAPQFADGEAGVARFFQPEGIVQGPSGSFYVADSGNRAIRKVSMSGVTTTVALFPQHPTRIFGTNPFSSIPSIGSVAVDADENVYVADTSNNVVRVVRLDGTTEVVAGRVGTSGAMDGVANGSLFNTPFGVAVDAHKNIYVADTFNHTVRKIAPDGNVTTLAGLAGRAGSEDGAGANARFSYPAHLAVDGNGGLYVSDYGNFTIRHVSADGSVTTILGRPGARGGPLSAVQASDFYFNVAPTALSFNPTTGELFFVDDEGILKMTVDGWVMLVAGKYGVWPSIVWPRIELGDLPASLREPRGVAATLDGQIAITSGNAVLITRFQ